MALTDDLLSRLPLSRLTTSAVMALTADWLSRVPYILGPIACFLSIVTAWKSLYFCHLFPLLWFAGWIGFAVALGLFLSTRYCRLQLPHGFTQHTTVLIPVLLFSLGGVIPYVVQHSRPSTQMPIPDGYALLSVGLFAVFTVFLERVLSPRDIGLTLVFMRYLLTLAFLRGEWLIILLVVIISAIYFVYAEYFRFRAVGDGGEDELRE